MFPVQSDEPIFDDLSIIEQDKILDDLLADYAASEANEPTDHKGVRKRPRTTSSVKKTRENKNEGCSTDSKKTVHRVTERQRRQEMTGLYASLRELLPLEYVKGKRAISDHMHQAMNYIKDMQRKIEEMKIKRDKLKTKLPNLQGLAADAEGSNSNISHSPYCVKVNHLTDGMEILISSSLEMRCSPLSKLLADLLDRGLNITSCVSTRGDRCFLHKIQIELNDCTSTDISKLQERLVNVIKLA